MTSYHNLHDFLCKLYSPDSQKMQRNNDEAELHNQYKSKFGAVTFLFVFVAQDFLSQQSAAPAAEHFQGVQIALGNSPFAADGRSFVNPIGQIGDDIYGNKLIDCNQEKEVLSRYINEIEKTKVKNILEEILWEGAIRYVEREGGLEIDHWR